MSLNPYIFTAVLCLAALIMFALAAYSVHKRATPAAPALAWLMTATCAWVIINLLGLLSQTEASNLFWHKAGYIAVANVPLAWAAFTLTYTHREKWVTARNLLALAIVPVAMVIVVWTNELHHLFWTSYRLSQNAGLMGAAVTFGPAGYISIVYTQGIMILGAALVLIMLYQSRGIYRRQTAWVAAGVAVPIIVNLLYVAKLWPIKSDLTTASFAVGGFLLAVGIFQSHLLDWVPVARDKIVESMADAVIVLDLQNRIVDLNPAAQALIGQTAAQAIGQTADQCFQSWPNLVERYRNRSEAQDEVVVVEGEAQYVYDLRLSLLTDRRGHLTGRLLVLRDITARKQTEDALQKSEQKFHSIVEHSTDGILLIDHQGRVIEWNHGMEQISGITWAEAMGQPAATIQARLSIHYSREALEAAFDQILQSGLMSRNFVRQELPIRHPSGANRVIEQTPFVIQADKGLMVCSLIRDITDRKRAEEEIHQLNASLEGQVNERTQQLSAANERLQALSRQLVEVQENERRRLALELHDELGQVLNSVKVSLDMMADLPQAVGQKQLQRAQNLIGDLIRRVRELALNLRPSMLDDLGLAAALTSLCRRHTSQTSANALFQNSVPEARRFPTPVETTIYRIAQEGLTNASRHAGVNQVNVALWLNENLLILEITDAGVGFVPEEVLAAPTTTGLSGMRERARLLGGELMIESSPGSGTRLTAYLPVAPVEPAAALAQNISVTES